MRAPSRISSQRGQPSSVRNGVARRGATVAADAADPMRGRDTADEPPAGADVRIVQPELECGCGAGISLDPARAAPAIGARQHRDRGGYAGAKATVKFITGYAALESERAGSPPEQVGKSVLEIALGERRDHRAYTLSSAGLSPVG